MMGVRTKRAAVAVLFAALLVVALSGQGEQVVAVEIGKHNTDWLPAGKEADGIIGDFVLRNGNIEALIGGNLPHRKANMQTAREGPIPGCLFDLDIRGAANDQLTALRPGGQVGALSWVRLVDDGGDGSARVEAVRTAAKGDGLYIRHEYRLDRGWKHLRITSTYRNESAEPIMIEPAPVWKEFSERWTVDGIGVGDAIDPFDKRAYAWGADGEAPAGEVSLAAGAERSYTIVVAPGSSPAAAYGVVAALTKPSGTVKGTAADDSSAAVHAAVLFPVGGEELPAYPDADGKFELTMPAGSYATKLVDIGRDEVSQAVTVKKDASAALEYQLERASTIQVAIDDERGGPSPCKLQVIGRDGTPTPNFGTHYRAHGNDHQYQSHDGRFTQQVPSGNYLVRITHGPEYDLLEREIEVGPGQTVEVAGKLRRTVDTTGWVATDFHAHSTPSGDNYCKTDDRIINFAAEHLEFVPTTEHNRIYDWEPHISRLGLSDRLKTVIGMELTGSGQHFNSFPLQRTPFAQDGGAPRWVYDPRINAVVLREAFEGGPERWVQANHPTVGFVFNDRNRDGEFDGGFAGFVDMIDAAEVWSADILTGSPRRMSAGRERENRTFGWLQMLNQGRHVWCVAVSDSHRIFDNGAGDWRTYVPSSTDEPGQIDPKEIIRNAKAGRMMITNGPFLEVETADGLPIGSSVISAGSIDLKVRVQTPNWMEVDRVQIMVNGRQRRQDNYSRRTHPGLFRDGALVFDETLTVKLPEDSHLIVVAIGEGGTIEKGWGRSLQSSMHPVAYTNPIYVDVDGKGFQANGDTLGHPLLVAKRE